MARATIVLAAYSATRDAHMGNSISSKSIESGRERERINITTTINERTKMYDSIHYTYILANVLRLRSSADPAKC